jgi:type II secretory ATPase GspE/PulE/Tfp pilus assembly ATPase PilB-like protein
VPKPAVPVPVPLGIIPGHPPRVYYTNKEGKRVSRPLYNHHLGPLTEEDMGEERLEEEATAAQRHHDTVNLIERLPHQEPNLIEVLSEKKRNVQQEIEKEELDRDLAQGLDAIFEEAYRENAIAIHIWETNPGFPFTSPNQETKAKQEIEQATN